MAVLHPKVVITNYPENQVEWLTTENNAEQPEMGTRNTFPRNCILNKKTSWKILPRNSSDCGWEEKCGLKCLYYTLPGSHKDDQGQIIELHCTYDPDSKSGGPNANRRVKGTLHWVSAQHAIPAEVRLYDHLFLKENPDDDEEEGADFTSFINPHSLEILTESLVEPSLASAPVESRYQFLRQGYFVVDPDKTNGKLVFNRIVGLRDTWAKIKSKEG